jgi:hypothetical protein
MSDIPDVGTIFDLAIPWPESLTSTMELPLTVTVRREPDLTDVEVEEQRALGTLKQLYQIVEFDEHHVISFGGSRWVYDFLGKAITFTGGCLIPGGEN